MANGQPSPAVCFRKEFPSGHDANVRSFLGGRPMLPTGLDWPRITVDGRNIALTFLGQIDLAHVARVVRLPGFPTSGILYFFADTCIITNGDFEDGMRRYGKTGAPWRVLYSGANAWHFRQSEKPAELMPCFGEAFDEGRLTYSAPSVQKKWIECTDWRKRYYSFECPKVALEPLAIQSFHKGYRNDVMPEQLEAWTKALGQPVRHMIRPERLRAYWELWVPSVNFPETVIYLEIACASLLQKILGHWENHVLSKIGAPFVSQLQKSVRETASADLFIETSRAQREGFWNITEQLAASHPDAAFALNEALLESYYWGTIFSLTFSADSADTVPKRMFELVRSSFAPLRDARLWPQDTLTGTRATVHQMGGFGREIQDFIESMNSSHLLLMQFDADRILGWDSGVLQFWITPDDLAALRFENVSATIADD